MCCLCSSWVSCRCNLAEISNLLIAVFLEGSGRLRFHSDSSRMRHIRRWVSAAGDRRLGTNAAQRGSSDDDDECQTRPSTKDLLASQLSERVTFSRSKYLSNMRMWYAVKLTLCVLSNVVFFYTKFCRGYTGWCKKVRMQHFVYCRPCTA